MNSLLKHLAIGCTSLFCLFSFPALAEQSANSGWYGGKADGWFWYKDPKEAPKKPLETPKPVADAPKPTEKPDDAMSAAWIRKNLPVFKERAIDNPTQENVAAYLSLQRVALDKAQRFEEAAMMVNMTHPWLDQSNFVPVSTYATDVFKDMETQAKESAFKQLSNIGGLFVFVDSTCQYCRAQAKPVSDLAHSYNMDLRFISKDGKGFPEIKNERFLVDNGIIKKLNIRVFPTTVFVSPPNNYLIISQGMMSQDEMKNRILMAASYENLLSEKEKLQVNPWDRGVLDTSDVKHGATDDPAKFNKYIEQHIQSRTPTE